MPTLNSGTQNFTKLSHKKHKLYSNTDVDAKLAEMEE